MDWQAILLKFLGMILMAFLCWASERIIIYFNSKTKNQKTMKLLTSALDVVNRSVKTTYQTYVQALKDKNLFDADAQKTALEMSMETAKSLFNDEIKTFITKNFGDIDTWIKNAIESELYDLKNQGKEGKKSE